MNSYYIFEYTDLLARILSIGYLKQYTTSSIERCISYSSYFQQIEKDNHSFAPLTTDISLVKSVFPDLNDDFRKMPIYVQCLWAAEAYLRIQGQTQLTFECIFLYLPIKNIYEYFPVYHEMGFTRIVERFNELYSIQSALSIIIDKYGYSLEDISKKTGISYNTLYSLKSRRRDISKINVETALKLSTFLHIRMETICEIKI